MRKWEREERLYGFITFLYLGVGEDRDIDYF